MGLFLILLAAALFFGVLWGPVCLVAYRSWQRGDARAFRQLRFLLPAQLVAVVVLAVAADLAGLRHPAALMAVLTAGIGLAGAGAAALLRLRLR